jgi:Tfp pilus assembly protein PilZ
MAHYHEKRHYRRYDCDQSAYLYKYDDRDTYYEADMCNYGKGGMYLNTNHKMDIDEQVYIKIKNYDENSKGPEKYKYYTGYVRWSNDLGTSYPDGQYGYGVEYEVPVSY